MDQTGYPPLIRRVFAHGKKIALTDDQGQYSYSDLARRAADVATCLLDGRTDLQEARVAFLISPGFEYTATLLGIWWAGGIAVPLGLQYPPAELDYFLGDSDPGLVIADHEFQQRIQPLAETRQIRFLATDQLSSGNQQALPKIRDERRAMILYTSGSTSRPKGVVTTHLNISAQIESLVEAWEWTSKERALHVLPLHHVHGIINVLGCALWAGGMCEMLPRFDPSRVFDAIISGRITTFMAVPTIYVKLISAWHGLSETQQEQFSHACAELRLMVSGSAALPVSVAEQWKEISGHTLLERYGMTEIGMALSNPLHGVRRLGSVGTVLPGVEVQLADERGEKITAEGVSGEIWVRGNTVFKEYWRQPLITEKEFSDGWFRTGDVAIVEEDYYIILGRSSVDIIKTGGYKISALETEEVLLRHPHIKECAVVGIEDEEWGERVAAVVALEPGHQLELAELREWASDKLVTYKLPSRLVTLDSLPRNAMGKVRKPDLKQFLDDQNWVT